MISELKNLSNSELELLNKAPLLVCILIAGADGEIDRKEIKEAIATAKKKASSTNSLREFYENVSEDFEDKLKVLVHSYPTMPHQRGQTISVELAGLNKIFSKVKGHLSIEIYESLISLALNIAKSSGGVFGLKTIGTEEARFVELKMIDPPTGLS